MQVSGPYEYTYRKASDLNSYPYAGTISVYGGGGFVVQLRGDRTAIFQKIADLKAGGWIDKYTRALFLEFTVYNANVSGHLRLHAAFSLSVAKRLFVTHYCFILTELRVYLVPSSVRCLVSVGRKHYYRRAKYLKYKIMLCVELCSRAHINMLRITVESRNVIC